MAHPLDRPIWTALTTRQQAIAQVHGAIRRYDSAFAPFAASAEGTATSLADLAVLVPKGGHVYLQQPAPIDAPRGLILRRVAKTVQMTSDRIEGPSEDFPFELLTAADAAEMLDLARLTRPGPFAERTHELGCFVGIRHRGHLVAMAGERMKAAVFTEISGVCTHPSHRGRGYAAALMRDLGRRILARGEMPFLHAFADNTGAIRIYEKLGFIPRSQPFLIELVHA